MFAVINVIIMGETAGTVFSACLEKLKHVKSDEGDMLTKPFLDVCKLVLPIIGVFSLQIYITSSTCGNAVLLARTIILFTLNERTIIAWTTFQFISMDDNTPVRDGITWSPKFNVFQMTA